MGYEVAVNKAWDNYILAGAEKLAQVKLLNDKYSVDIEARKILSFSCNVPAKDYTAIIILHYLKSKLQGLLDDTSGQWLDFRELSGVEGYQSAFRQRVIERVIKKFGGNPQGLLAVLERFPGKVSRQADAAIILEVFEKVPVLIQLWKGDEEFAPEANVLFDKSITKIFCTEDIVVLAEFIVHQL